MGYEASKKGYNLLHFQKLGEFNIQFALFFKNACSTVWQMLWSGCLSPFQPPRFSYFLWDLRVHRNTEMSSIPAVHKF